MTMQPNLETTVGELVTERPARSRLFESLGIDYCCGGKLPLAEACRRAKLDAETVARMLAALEAEPSPTETGPDPARMTLTELADHIEEKHHAFLRAELPRLSFLLEKLAGRHGGNHPWLVQTREIFEDLNAELSQHMMKEERILFPILRRLEAGEEMPDSFLAQLHCPVDQMEREHEYAGQALARLRELTGGYRPPDDGCNTFRAAMSGLEDLERDTHRHIHLENNILFPRGLERAARVTA